MSSRESAVLSLAMAPPGVGFRVARIIRPSHLNDRLWQGSLLRLEELGIFQGQSVEKAGVLGPLGAVIVKAGGSRVAVSRELAGAIMVRRG